MELNKIHLGNNLDLLKQLEDNSISSIVTDPPYELNFMNKSWDNSGISYNVELWKECLRVLKPGGHLLAFGGSRTYHRICCAIEDAGFEIRDQIMWIYGSGFPKSTNISKQINKNNGVKFKSQPAAGVGFMKPDGDWNITKNQLIQEGESVEDAKEWDGWGTALKPAHEPIVFARKPLSEKTIASNVLKYGTGAINIDDCRISTEDNISNHSRGKESAISKGIYGDSKEQSTHQTDGQKIGRWPANIIFDEVAGELLDEQTGELKAGKAVDRNRDGNLVGNKIYGARNKDIKDAGFDDKGGASRFFYCAKASRSEKEKGLDNLDFQNVGMSNGAQIHGEGYDKGQSIGLNRVRTVKNIHPTVKPIKLIEYLIKLVTPPGGITLDIFEGSGTHALAAKRLGFNYIGFELNEEYFNIANQRIQEELI